MIISFSNQKGGVGKSTHCALFAYYLSEKEKDVHVIDMDTQQSVGGLRNREKPSLSQQREKEENVFDNPLNYTVQTIFAESILPFIKSVIDNKNSVYIIDTPGTIADDNVVKTLLHSDYIIIPFNYEGIVLDSTAVFIQICKKFRIGAKLIFLPTNVDVRVKFEATEQIRELLSDVGVVTPVCYQFADFKRFSTVSMSKLQREKLFPVYDFIYEQLTF